MNRKQARRVWMQLLFQCEAQGDYSLNAMDVFLRDVEPGAKQEEYIRTGFLDFVRHREEVDDAISRHLDKWSLNHLPKAELAILRLAATEILFREDIPNAVAVNEAVELSKVYGEDKAPGFINGVLWGIVRETEQEQA